jgi:ADP-ribose pyrophosphatase YjhB (NUDIX family)
MAKRHGLTEHRCEEAGLSRTPLRSPVATCVITAMLRPFWRMGRGLTLGAQGVVIDADDRVLLVRHSYRPGWFFPGGGVEWGETLEEALARELEEEVGVTLTAAPVLHGLFSNNSNFPGDHIAVYLIRKWTRRDGYRQKGEIAEAEMFAADDVPALTDPGTRVRLAEIYGNAPISPHWNIR